MAISPQTVQIFKYILIFIATISVGWYLFSDHDYHETLQVAVSGKKGVFIQKAMRTDIDGPFDDSTLVEICQNTEWREGLIIQCESPYGGVANIRNVLLNCLRYAIEAGGTSTHSFSFRSLTSQQHQSSSRSSDLGYPRMIDQIHQNKSQMLNCRVEKRRTIRIMSHSHISSILNSSRNL